MIKYILTHPIQYQSPLIAYLSKKIKIHVLYRSNISTKKHFESTFNRKIIISRDLLKGYKYSYLNKIGPNKVTLFYPITTDFIKNIFTDDTKIIWVHGIKYWYNVIIIILSKLFKRKVFVRDEYNNLKNRSSLNLFLNRIFFYIMDKFIDVYLSIGSVNTSAYLSNGISKKKIFLVPYAVNNSHFKKKKINRSKKINVIFSGTLIRRKGCDLLLKSIVICNNYKNFKKDFIFTIVGDGPDIKKYKEYKKKNKLSNVKFVGFKNQNSIKKYYHKSKILILPSREENWGLVINEAMSAKNMIISADTVGASKDLVINNYNGYTFISGDYRDLAKKILKVYKKKSNIDFFCNNSFKLISSWTFRECFNGLNRAIKYIQKKNA